jgi:hypothetical protein
MNYYTYIYIDPIKNIPRYVGYGHGNRAYSHLVKSHNKSFAGWIRNLKEKSLTPIIIKEDVRSISEAKILEIFWISIYGRLDKKTGCLFNHTDGGEGVSGRIYNHSDETKKKMSETRTGRSTKLKGRKLTEEHKAKIGRSGEDNAFFGKTHKEETKQKQSEVMKGRLVGENNGFYGKTHSPGVIEKIKKANIGKKHSEEAKRKIGEASRNRIRKPMSEETKKKILETKRLRRLDK